MNCFFTGFATIAMWNTPWRIWWVLQILDQQIYLQTDLGNNGQEPIPGFVWPSGCDFWPHRPEPCGKVGLQPWSPHEWQPWKWKITVVDRYLCIRPPSHRKGLQISLSFFLSRNGTFFTFLKQMSPKTTSSCTSVVLPLRTTARSYGWCHRLPLNISIIIKSNLQFRLAS